jgi:hypothetical protein
MKKSIISIIIASVLFTNASVVFAQHCELCSTGFYLLIAKADIKLNPDLKLYLMEDSNNVARDVNGDTVFLKPQILHHEATAYRCFKNPPSDYFELVKGFSFPYFAGKNYYIAIIQIDNKIPFLKIDDIKNKYWKLMDVRKNYQILCSMYFNEGIMHDPSLEFTFTDYYLETFKKYVIDIEAGN